MIRMTIVLLVILSVVIAAIVHIIWLAALALSLSGWFNIHYSPFGYITLTVILIMWLIAGYGMFIGRWQLKVTTTEFSHKDIPAAFDGYKIVHISDIHLSTFDDNKGHLKEIVSRINSLEPDLVCITGDLVNTDFRETLPYVESMSSIRATDGVVSVLGNHDFMLYSNRTKEEKDAAVDSLVRVQTNLFGWKVLRNSNIMIERNAEKISIIGVDNTSCKGQGFQTIAKGDLKAAMQGTEDFKILLSHDPSHWTYEVVPETDIQLTLSGHTHAAQIRIFGWTPASWMFDQTDGRYDIQDQTLHINIGLGCTAPLRIGAIPEISLINLRQESDL